MLYRIFANLGFLTYQGSFVSSKKVVNYLSETLENADKYSVLADNQIFSVFLKEKLIVDQLQFSITNSNMVRSGMEVNMETEGACDRDGSVLDYCRCKRITIQTWSPFQYGMFEGPFLGNPKFAELNAVLDRIAEKYGVSSTTIAAAWILRHPAKMQILSGSMKLSRQEEICQADAITLTREEWYQIYLSAGHILP